MHGDGKDLVRTENLVWVRVFAAMAEAIRRNLPFFVWHRIGLVSPFEFDEYKAIQGAAVCRTEIMVDTDTGATLPFACS